MDLADQLQYTQDRLDLKRYQLADELQITPEWLSKIMRRRVRASGDISLRLAEALRRRNLNPDLFFESSSVIGGEDPQAKFGEGLKAVHPLQVDKTPNSPSTQPPARNGQVIFPSDSTLPQVPANPPFAQDVRSYIEMLLSASDGDPKRVGRLLDELKEKFETTRQYWLKNPNA